MTSDAQPVSSAVYVAVLQRGVGSPTAPRSDEEPVTGDEPETPAAAATPHPVATKGPAPANPEVTIDFDGILQRILALPVAQTNYVGLSAGGPGELFLIAQPIASITDEPPPLSVAKFDLASRATTPLLDGISAFALSFNGQKMLYQRGPMWFVVPAKSPPRPGEGVLATASMETYVEPRLDWRQMYRETWRIERDFFYDPNYHGLNIAAAEQRFAPYLDGLGARSDLTFLFEEMLSYLSVGHMFVRGGNQPQVPRVTVGLLGADYSVDHDRYRFARVYNGENWNPELRAPLTQPGEQVNEGEYLLAVNGQRRSRDAERL